MLRAETVTISELLEYGLENVTLVDVRSPSEYQHDHIPGAINIPILDDDERRQVGTTYKQVGPAAARLLGVDLVSPKLPQFIRSFQDVQEKRRPVVVYCWRGGLRSFSAYTLVNLAGFRVCRLVGGYASFRKEVNSFFDEQIQQYSLITLYGPTGCGKTEVLRELNGTVPVVDLEKAADHKGSSFGAIGEPGYLSSTQKRFESRVWHDMYRNRPATTFVVEGESRKIGRVTVPPRFFQRMMEGKSVVAECPMDFRVSFTIENYQPEQDMEGVRNSLLRLRQSLGNAKIDHLLGLLDAKDFAEFTRILLVEYYDPLYRHSFPEHADAHLSYGSIAEGAAKIAELFRTLTGAAEG